MKQIFFFCGLYSLFVLITLPMRNCASTLESEITRLEMNSILNVLLKKKFVGTHLEIGTAAGGTLCQIISCYQKMGYIPPFMVIDPMKYFPFQFEKICKNLEDYSINPSSVEFIKCTSREAYLKKHVKETFLDFILVDGSHKIRYVTQDLMWSNYLRTGGILCAHDYSPDYPGVYSSINRFLDKNKNYKILSQVDNLLIIEKNKPNQPGKLGVSFGDLVRATALAPLFQLKASLKKRFKKLNLNAFNA